ncbi:hypothetical protein J7E45_12430 [Microbacterium sp. ISL-59]|uniref:hypothetical protein n=1 Tax=Microbacterium sp. ISL-59 TaxID=2819159 RepID=UPI001BE8F630|nr:hypothetical protein [Microbacterium sp. ISL-59]MBT2496415.1 hypothetical protein [Microbacterium sp. ISL-59]
MHDREQFEATAAVLRGDRELSDELQTLARWISETFDTDVVNIVVDALHDATPRVNVWLRSAAQARAFRNGDGGNYDRAKQTAVSRRYVETRPTRPRSASDPEPFVTFRAFEPEARDGAIDLAPTELETLRDGLASPALWRIMVAWGRVVFFVHTDAEATALREGPEFDRWTTEFLSAARPRDEFDLVPRLPPVFELDSKERFDRDFQGSSYYYFL